jgi:hypothetical protein
MYYRIRCQRELGKEVKKIFSVWHEGWPESKGVDPHLALLLELNLVVNFEQKYVGVIHNLIKDIIDLMKHVNT